MMESTSGRRVRRRAPHPAAPRAAQGHLRVLSQILSVPDLGDSAPGANSRAVRAPEESAPVSVDMRELPLHEQTGESLTENEVTETLTGEVTPESREVVEDLYADLQEEEADRQAEERRD